MKLEHLKLVKLNYFFLRQSLVTFETHGAYYSSTVKEKDIYERRKELRERNISVRKNIISCRFGCRFVSTPTITLYANSRREKPLCSGVLVPRVKNRFPSVNDTLLAVASLTYVLFATWLNVLSIQRIRNAGNTHSLLSWFIIWRPRKRGICSGQSVALTTAVHKKVS